MTGTAASDTVVKGGPVGTDRPALTASLQATTALLARRYFERVPPEVKA